MDNIENSSREWIDAPVLEQLHELATRFSAGAPVKNVVIENFLRPDRAEALLRDFPSFDPSKAINEFGEVGNKAVQERISTISKTYAGLYGYLGSTEFLDIMGRLTGIDGLRHDPNLYGGGTHENRHGQELDPHIDFNYDPPTKLHRRLNLLIYLNKDWQPEWGGQIELHSNPRKPKENKIESWDPLFNRALIFETNEISWHGFPRIQLPENKRHLSRKSLSIYLYTESRPAEEIVPEHGTFYVQRWLPECIRPGHTLTDADVARIEELLMQRDGWIEHYQRAELRTSAQMGTLNDRLRQGPLNRLISAGRAVADRIGLTARR